MSKRFKFKTDNELVKFMLQFVPIETALQITTTEIYPIELEESFILVEKREGEWLVGIFPIIRA